MSPIRCLLTGESPVILTALGLLLDDEFEVECVASNQHNFSEALKRFRPNVVVIDHDPDDHGARLQACAKVIRPAPEVLFLALRSVGSNGCKCISRSGSPQQFVAAIRMAARRVPGWLHKSLNGPVLEDAAPGDAARLSVREQQVLREISLGKRMKEVAYQLGISPRTVAFHKYRAMQANGLRNNYELLQFCIRNGLLNPLEGCGK